jgi:hypothetical protein
MWSHSRGVRSESADVGYAPGAELGAAAERGRSLPPDLEARIDRLALRRKNREDTFMDAA